MTAELCISNIHDDDPVEGTVRGTFETPHAYVVGVWYCDKCSAAGQAFGMFTPDDTDAAESEIADEMTRNDHK
ncbi:hypothetical protein SEA_BOSSLADY_44 [Arthrobacter phage BossLady]|uniref:Uncharacterized protein n=1 Tax=Arthrobacter phage BossLady TaxID=2603258 RepID=A0A5B8WME0_9CAUD|nr:hypothetical protein SEA_BOSSLADY_44 [Arthrobacter phage BossLady]